MWCTKVFLILPELPVAIQSSRLTGDQKGDSQLLSDHGGDGPIKLLHPSTQPATHWSRGCQKFIGGQVPDGCLVVMGVCSDQNFLVTTSSDGRCDLGVVATEISWYTTQPLPPCTNGSSYLAHPVTIALLAKRECSMRSILCLTRS